ncbi:MAG: PAS domain-containing protein, partial [Ghiorsea sp.]|nr:PAS domain-containing protein [Ghiorsea sp.]
MRNNQPVNNTEHRMKPGDVLVSKTDLKGKITYANEGFCEIAGMTEEELIGQPHNVVRHPDMPSAAFEDLWQTMKAGKPWTGYVKNRSADGGYYWVHACVAPEFDDQGNAIGYISVRTYPSDQDIHQAENLYKKVNAGAEKLASTLKFSLFNRIKIKAKLIAVSILSTITLLALLWMVYGSLSKTITKDEMHIQGLEYVVAIRHLMEDLPKHRGMVNAYLHGDKALAAPLRMKQEDVNQSFEELIQVAKKYNERYSVLADIEQTKREWTNLAGQWQAMSAQDVFHNHTLLTDKLLALSSQVAVLTGLLSAESITESMSAQVLAMQSL